MSALERFGEHCVHSTELRMDARELRDLQQSDSTDTSAEGGEGGGR